MALNSKLKLMPKFFKKQSEEDFEDFQPNRRQPIATLVSWTAPSRPFRKKDRSYFTTIAILVSLLVLILLLAHEFMLIGALLALAFVTYVLGFIPPEDIDYKISTQGITIGDHFSLWNNLESFWFSEKEGQTILNIETNLRFPAQLLIVLGEQNQEKIKNIMAKYLPFHEIAPRSFVDKWSESLQKHFPLENPH